LIGVTKSVGSAGLKESLQHGPEVTASNPSSSTPEKKIRPSGTTASFSIALVGTGIGRHAWPSYSPIAPVVEA
jgi:hypothetical protein